MRFSFIKVNGKTVVNFSDKDMSDGGRGINTIILDPETCQAMDRRVWDTHSCLGRSSGKSAASDLAAYIDYVREGTILLGSTADEPSMCLREAVQTLQSAGVDVRAAVNNQDSVYRGKFAFVLHAGYPERTTMKKASKGGANLYMTTFLKGW